MSVQVAIISGDASDGFDALELARSRVGSVVDGKYELLDLIGLGATGAVYRAQNRWARRVCAVKLFNYQGANEEGVLRRFVREAQAIHRVQSCGRLHPNVVDAIDVGRDAATGCFFVVQELLRGETLGAYLARMPGGRLALGNALKLLRPVVDAIACAHEGGVVHRDLKPDNVLLTNGPDGGIVPKVLDFGIAQIADERLTPVNDFMGTPQYMPPEAFGGAGLVDARADVWALGVILYEMLSGASPFAPTGPDPMESMELVQHRWPASLAALGVAPTTVWNVVRRALMKAPAQRYANAREFLDALEGALRPVRTVRVTLGATPEQVRRMLRDPAWQSVAPSAMRSLAPPPDEPDAPRGSLPPRAPWGDRRSIVPRATMVPMPANDGADAVDAGFTGDASKHWWSVHFQSSGHGAQEVLDVLALPELAQVVELHVSNCPLGDAGVEALVASPRLRDLNALTLCRVGLTARGVLAIARAPSLASLVKLDLEQNAIGTDGLRTLLAGRHLQNLRALSLVLTNLDADAGEAFAEGSRLARLLRLDLSQNALGDEGALSLASYDRLSPELQLVLARNRIKPRTAEGLQGILGRRIRKLVV